MTNKSRSIYVAACVCGVLFGARPAAPLLLSSPLLSSPLSSSVDVSFMSAPAALGSLLKNSAAVSWAAFEICPYKSRFQGKHPGRRVGRIFNNTRNTPRRRTPGQLIRSYLCEPRPAPHETWSGTDPKLEPLSRSLSLSCPRALPLYLYLHAALCNCASNMSALCRQ